MGRHKRNEQRTEQFTKWVLNHRLLPAWKALSFPARDAYFHLAVRCLAETAEKKGSVPNNNGAIFRSLRDLASDMGCSVKTAAAALADLQAKGWIVCTDPWVRGVEGKGKTAKFRLTMMPTAKQAATQEPKHWQFRPRLRGEAFIAVTCLRLARLGQRTCPKNRTHPPIRAQSCIRMGHNCGRSRREVCPTRTPKRRFRRT
jgi:hypothetical protein